MLAAALPVHVFATGGDDFDVPAVTVGESLDFLPGKSLGEIFLETGETPADSESPDFGKEILEIADRLGAKSPAQLLPEADALLAKARQHYSSGGDWCNLLHDVRDVLTGTADDRKAAADYIKWRIENKDRFFAVSRGTEPLPADAAEMDLEKRADETVGPLRAHWLYLRGAELYRTGDREECRKWFQRVVREFPKHPRAEIALFMDARCAFSATRKTWTLGEPPPPDEKSIAAQKRATELFERYRKQYPRGRFVSDALGWLGALAFDAGKYVDALDCYIAQAETPGHPETLKSAIFMCERALAAVAATPEGSAAFAQIARHPRIAMGFTYLVLSAREADNYDGKYDRPLDVKKWRRTILPRIAAEVVKQKQRYKDGDWQPRYLSLLAQAASAEGNQAQALQLTDLAPAALERSDDLLLVRGIALQRAGRSADAITTFRKLLGNFPDAPIAPGVRLRLAFALQDDHDAGGALIEFLGLLQNGRDRNHAITQFPYTSGLGYPSGTANWSLPESAVYPNITGANIDQIQDAIDTLLNFAPLSQLAAASERDGFGEAEKRELRAIIAERYLAQENFEEAKKFMPPERFALVAAELEKLTALATGSAAEMMRLGDAWAAARGRVLRVPLETKIALIPYFRPLSGLVRRANGRSLHLSEIDRELEQRDELRHAARWWLAAARANPGTPLAAQARWKALEAMPKIARASDYAEERAREIKGEAVSREIFARLQKEAPDSVEAKRLAAYWSFPPAPTPEAPYRDESVLRDARIMGYPRADYGAFGGGVDAYEEGLGLELRVRISGLRKKSEVAEPAQFAVEVRHLDAAARREMSWIGDVTAINFLDDLAQFSSEPNLTREMQRIYLEIRFMVLQSNGWEEPGIRQEPPVKRDDEIRAKIDEALKNPAMQPVADYLEFSRIGLVAGTRTELQTDIVDPKGDGAKVTVRSRDYATLEKMARDFLRKYPRSKKRESAMFVVARSVHALSRPYICEVGIPVPGTNAADDIFDIVEKSYQAEPFDPKRVLAALDDYDREYPDGRYAADARNLRAMTLWRTRDWGGALDLTIPQLHDRAKRDLQNEAAVRLTNIFAALEQAENRADVLEAVRARPSAIQHLKSFLKTASNDRDHPLRYLQAYLNDQLKLNSAAKN